jgi:hypothetical protein
MMRLRNLMVAALLAVLFSAATASAQQVKGTVKDVYPGPMQFVVTDQNGTAHVFKMDEDAQVYIDGMPGTLEDLREGDRVTVTYRVDEANWLAIEVRCWH